MSGYVAFEGLEGAGKSTVAARLAERFRREGHTVVTVREPGGTDLGEGIRSLLLDPRRAVDPWAEAALFAASRAQLAAEIVRPALESGAWVFSDRTVYSSLAYQGGGRQLGIEEVRRLNAAALAGTWPDRVVLLRVDASEGLRRQDGDDRIGREALDFHLRVGKAFDELAAADPDRFIVVDAHLGLDEVVDEVHDRLRP